MSRFISLTCTFALLAAPLINAAAVAIRADSGNSTASAKVVTPGPGLPSLESLGLTSEGLYKQPAPDASTGFHGVHTEFQAFCGGGRGDTANVDDVIACFNYLQHLGHTECVLPPNANQNVEFCSAGTAHIRGYNPTNHQSASYCSDVALGVQWVFTNCNTNGQVEGDQAANGNGDVVAVVGGPF